VEVQQGDEFSAGEDFESALEGGGGNVGGVAEVVLARGAAAVSTRELPEAEVDGLFGGRQIRKHGTQQGGEVHGVDIAFGWRKEEKGRVDRRRGEEEKAESFRNSVLPCLCGGEVPNTQ